MSRDFKEVAAAALELPRSARAELAGQLLDSLDDLSEEESDQLWAEEAERRYAAFQSGDTEAVPAAEVFARLRARAK
ncbi:MAG TPA: addiction module protein [Thermoanaerobaculia bacterium]|jgi:putative addiction module component (TIGR02574 family)|nr:addiction module protein [Thermoanaerobaculia bacterium]